MTDICERLNSIAVCNPDTDSGNTVIADICRDAIAEITRLRATVYGQGARLDQLHSIVGAAMAEPLVTFADIKKEIRNGQDAKG